MTAQASPAATFSHDAAGNITSDGTRTYEWDERSQLKKITHPTGTSEFTYDGRGRRAAGAVQREAYA